MSYCAYVSFKKIDQKAIYDFFSELKKSSIEKLKDIAEDEWGYCPLCRKWTFNPFEKLSDEDTLASIMLDDKYRGLYSDSLTWVDRVFSWRFGYDEEYGLLYVFGIPSALRNMFDGTVFFQNSCERDYEKSDYDGIDQFLSVYDKWMNVPDEEIIKKLRENDEDGFYDEIDDDTISYSKRLFCYDEIWSHFADALYDDDHYPYISMFKHLSDSYYEHIFVLYCFETAKKKLL